MRALVPFLTLLLALLILSQSCGGKPSSADATHPLPDTLNVGTLYSPTGFFILKGDTMGYDYDRVCDFARSHGIALRFKVARSMPELLKMLDKRSVDLLACEIPVTAEYKSRVLHCGAVNSTHQVSTPLRARRPYPPSLSSGCRAVRLISRLWTVTLPR